MESCLCHGFKKQLRPGDKEQDWSPCKKAFERSLCEAVSVKPKLQERRRTTKKNRDIEWVREICMALQLVGLGVGPLRLFGTLPILSQAPDVGVVGCGDCLLCLH